MSDSIFIPIESVNTIKNIKNIFIPVINPNYYHFICETIQTLATIIGDGEKLTCPIYINDNRYNDTLKYFTTGELLPFPKKHAATISEERSLWVHNYFAIARPDCLSIAKKIIRKQLQQTVVADQVVIIQRKHHRKIENIDNICAVTENILKTKPIVFYPEDHRIDQTIDLLQRTKVLIAPHGAGISNTIFMQDDTKILEVFPPEWENPVFKRYIQSLNSNIQHLQVVQQIKEEDLYKYPEDFIEYRRKQPYEASDQNKYADYQQIAKDCKLTNGWFTLDEQRFKEALETMV